MSRLLLELAHLLRFFPALRPLQNKLLAASWNVQRKSGKGPWECSQLISAFAGIVIVGALWFQRREGDNQ